MQVQFSITQMGYDYVQRGEDSLYSRVLTSLVNSGMDRFESDQLVASIAQSSGIDLRSAYEVVETLVSRGLLAVSGVQTIAVKGPVLETGKGYHVESIPAWGSPGADLPHELPFKEVAVRVPGLPESFAVESPGLDRFQGSGPHIVEEENPVVGVPQEEYW